MSTEPHDSNAAVVRRLYEATGNPDVIRQVLAPDVRWEVVPGFPHSGVYLGLNAVFNFFTRLFDDFEEWRTEPSEILATGDHVFAVGTYSARANATGRSFHARFAHLWRLRDGLIVRLQQCADTVQIAKALGDDLRAKNQSPLATEAHPTSEHGGAHRGRRR